MELVTGAIVRVAAFPWLWVPHCVLMCLALRSTLGGANSLVLARARPLSCFLLAVTYTFSGAGLGLLLRCQPLLSLLTWSSNVQSFTVVWYLMFFCPGDLLERWLTRVPVLPFLAACQDWLRLLAVTNGVGSIMAEHPNSFLYPFVFGSVVANGFLFVKFIEKCVTSGVVQGLSIEHYTGKTMVVASFLLTAEAHGYIPYSRDTLFSFLVIVTVTLRLVTSFLFKDWDPYCTAENRVCSLLYGSPICQEGKGKGQGQGRGKRKAEGHPRGDQAKDHHQEKEEGGDKKQD